MSIKIRWKRTAKQALAWKYLTDTVTTVLFFGGGAGGAKSFLGCAWIILMAVTLKGSRWFIARRTLKDLKESTLETFFEICGMWGLKAKGQDSDWHYRYNSQDGYILFKNGSKVVLKELKSKPSDPNFEGVGSTEYTGGFIDESPQVAEKAVDAMMSRIRFKLDDFGFCQSCGYMGAIEENEKPEADEMGQRDPLTGGKCKKCKKETFNSLIPKLFLTGNPSKKWPYREFYLKTKALITGIGAKIEPYKKFIQALVGDNPFISPHYVANLRKLKNKAMKERLLNGNWEWDDDEAKMFDYGKIVDIFSANVEADSSNKYISCDVARKGVDKTVVMLWHGWVVVNIISLPKDQYHKTTQISAFLKTYARKEKVPRSNIVIDEGGVGGGVVDEMEETNGHNQVFAFNGSNSPIIPDLDDETKDRQSLNYGNLRAQSYDALANLVDDSGLCIHTEDSEVKDWIIEELGLIKQKDIDGDSKIYIVAKKLIKEDLGRSPDYADALMMRMVFDLGINDENDLITSVDFDF